MGACSSFAAVSYPDVFLQSVPFIAEIKHHTGYDPSYRPTRQKITILLKVGRRTLLNYDELHSKPTSCKSSE